MKNILVFALILFSMISTYSCNNQQIEEIQKDKEQVTIAKIVRGDIENTTPLTGSIDAKDAIQIYPRATGKISQKLLREGDKVNKDQPIAIIERDEIGFEFKPMPVVSPIDGIVGRILIDVGSNVTPQTPIGMVVRPEKMRCKVDVPERYLSTAKLGMMVPIDVNAIGLRYYGIITAISTVVDEKTRTAKIEVELDNSDGKLIHGMYGKMIFPIEKHSNTLLAPLNSISWEGKEQYIYKVVDGKIQKVQAQLGLRSESSIEILEGVIENDIVVTGNLLKLKDGDEVIVKEGSDQQ